MRRDDQIIARIEDGVGRERIVDAAADAPAGEIDVGRPCVEQLDEFLPHVMRRRMIHDFIDDDVLRGGNNGETQNQQ